VVGDSASEEANVIEEEFGALPDGRPVSVFALTNANGIEIRVIDYGGIIVSIMAPDRDGEFADIVLGYDDLGGYLEVTPYFGAVIGRYGNRIAGGRFTLDGTEYELATNDNTNHLHGGNVGYDKVLWSGTTFGRADGVGVTFAYESAAGEEGYPGALSAEFDYFLNNDNELVIDYRATSDAPTPVNLTHHSYFNLAGSGDILGHQLMINADRYTPVDETLIPTGEWAPVAGTPFDFTTPTAIGVRIDDDDEQLARGLGYDHNFVLARDDDGASVSADGGLPAMVSAARVVDPVGGRVLEVETTEPGLQFYSGNFLDGTLTGKGRQTYEHRSGLCLESQHFPDSPNQPGFPSTILRPGEQYRSRTIYRFTTDRR
jgi:aldose 1-epimerase